MGMMYIYETIIMEAFMKKIKWYYSKEKKILIELQNVQAEIKELSRFINKPSLNEYTNTSQEFSYLNTNSSKDREALFYIGDVIEGKSDPRNIPTIDQVGINNVYYKNPNPKLFWSTFEKYCHEMAVYVSDDTQRKQQLVELKNKEMDLKYKLGIDKKYN
jgi:hypothetical protein